MLRQVELEGQPVSEAARAFGFSRPLFYQAQAAFEKAGLMGLLPQKRGPRGGHKLTAEVIDFVIRTREQDASVSWEQIGSVRRQLFIPGREFQLSLIMALSFSNGFQFPFIHAISLAGGAVNKNAFERERVHDLRPV
jgi:hypothetical protein